MKKKTAKAEGFIEGLHDFVVSDLQFRKNTAGRSEVQIQTEIRPLILRYLENYFVGQGYADGVAKANQAFYWEGQEGSFDKESSSALGSRSYPDFIILMPYKVAIECKQGPNGSLVKQGIGQSIIHTLSGDYDFAYLLFHDQSKDKRIESSTDGEIEQTTMQRMWRDFNVLIKFV